MPLSVKHRSSEYFENYYVEKGSSEYFDNYYVGKGEGEVCFCFESHCADCAKFALICLCISTCFVHRCSGCCLSPS